MEKILTLVKIEGRRRRGQVMRWLYGITDSMDMNLSKLWEMVKNREDWSAAVHGSQTVRLDLLTKKQPTISKDPLFPASLPTLVVYCLFDKSHSNRCEVISHCGFDLHVPNG